MYRIVSKVGTVMMKYLKVYLQCSKLKKMAIQLKHIQKSTNAFTIYVILMKSSPKDNTIYTCSILM